MFMHSINIQLIFKSGGLQQVHTAEAQHQYKDSLLKFSTNVKNISQLTAMHKEMIQCIYTLRMNNKSLLHESIHCSIWDLKYTSIVQKDTNDTFEKFVEKLETSSKHAKSSACIIYAYKNNKYAAKMIDISHTISLPLLMP